MQAADPAVNGEDNEGKPSSVRVARTYPQGTAALQLGAYRAVPVFTELRWTFLKPDHLVCWRHQRLQSYNTQGVWHDYQYVGSHGTFDAVCNSRYALISATLRLMTMVTILMIVIWIFLLHHRELTGAQTLGTCQTFIMCHLICCLRYFNYWIVDLHLYKLLIITIIIIIQYYIAPWSPIKDTEALKEYTINRNYYILDCKGHWAFSFLWDDCREW